jgi:hypothetical protein
VDSILLLIAVFTNAVVEMVVSLSLEPAVGALGFPVNIGFANLAQFAAADPPRAFESLAVVHVVAFPEILIVYVPVSLPVGTVPAFRLSAF